MVSGVAAFVNSILLGIRRLPLVVMKTMRLEKRLEGGGAVRLLRSLEMRFSSVEWLRKILVRIFHLSVTMLKSFPQSFCIWPEHCRLSWQGEEDMVNYTLALKAASQK